MKKEKKKSKYSKPKFLITFTIVMGLFAAVRHVFAINIPLERQETYTTEDEFFVYTDETGIDDMAEDGWANQDEKDNESKTDSVKEEEPIDYEAGPDSMPFDYSHHETVVNTPDDNLQIEHPINDSTDEKKAHRIKGVWSYAKCFDDIQDIQILAAKKHGIRPVRNRTEAEILVRKHKLVNIGHSPFYTVDDLTHSIPYLVPRAQHLLNTISLNFIDSCQVKGLPIHLLMVTSVLRTTDDVSNLQRGNKNATTNSCHCYGTTVDIAYNRFMPVTGTYYQDAALLRWNEPMKQVLAEVLDDLKRQRKCYVKYERKQGCFHLTVR